MQASFRVGTVFEGILDKRYQKHGCNGDILSYLRACKTGIQAVAEPHFLQLDIFPDMQNLLLQAYPWFVDAVQYVIEQVGEFQDNRRGLPALADGKAVNGIQGVE